MAGGVEHARLDLVLLGVRDGRGHRGRGGRNCSQLFQFNIHDHDGSHAVGHQAHPYRGSILDCW